MHKADVPRFISEATNKALVATMGVSSTAALLYYANVSTVADDPEAFAQALYKILGRGAEVLLRQITDELKVHAGLPREKDADFASSIKKIRSALESSADMG